MSLADLPNTVGVTELHYAPDMCTIEQPHLCGPDLHINKPKKQTWTAARRPNDARDLYWLAKWSIRGGLFWAFVVGIPASFVSCLRLV